MILDKVSYSWNNQDGSKKGNSTIDDPQLSAIAFYCYEGLEFLFLSAKNIGNFEVRLNNLIIFFFME